MHVSTETGKKGDSGRLVSKEMTPRRDCHVQCLQFFYYHSGNETDQLNVWIREYQNETDTIGTLRLMDQITGDFQLADDTTSNSVIYTDLPVHWVHLPHKCTLCVYKYNKSPSVAAQVISHPLLLTSVT